MSLTLQFIPYHEIEDLGSARRVHKILDIVKDNKIVVLEGRLRKEEEADLIEITMEQITNKFKGIELAVIFPEKKTADGLDKLKQSVLNAMLGNRRGLTIIGPASIVKDIKKNPDKIELLTKDSKKKR